MNKNINESSKITDNNKSNTFDKSMHPYVNN